jgi:hypothetical protein
MSDQKTKIEFANETEIPEDAYLWRYLDLHKFLSFVIGKSLFFSRLDKFEDKLEGISLIHLYYKNLKSEMDNHPAFDDMRQMFSINNLSGEMEQIDKEISKTQEFNFANCWVISKSHSESVAMWNLYSQPNSVAIKIKYKDFKSLLQKNGLNPTTTTRESDIICSPVRYIDFQNSNQEQQKIKGIRDSVFFKDISFKHEAEFRIIIREQPYEKPPIKYRPPVPKRVIEYKYNEKVNYPGINMELINFDDYPFEVIHHPKSQDWAKENVAKILGLSNLDLKLKDSNLELK